MSDYISRDQARNALIGFECYTGIDELPVEYAGAVIDRLPGIDIVRCEECIRASVTDIASGIYCSKHKMFPPKDFFCAAGIRKSPITLRYQKLNKQMYYTSK